MSARRSLSRFPIRDYAYTDWIYGPTALFPDDEPPMYPVVPLSSSVDRVHVG